MIISILKEVKKQEARVALIPKNVGELYQRGYDMWGSELMLARESAYPIKSYLDFEAVDEDKQFDPMSVCLEVLAKIKKEEIVAIQILLEPDSPAWRDEWKALVEKLRLKEDPKKTTRPFNPL